jgi:Icc-related predicted phosphoesterase
MHGEFASVQAAIDVVAPDLLISCGDWGEPGQIDASDLSAVTERVLVRSVYGNHDDIEFLSQARNMDSSPVLLAPGEVDEISGVRIAGISGIWAKTRLGSRLNAQWQSARRQNPALTVEKWLAGRPLPPYVTDEDVAALAAKLARRRIDILISHACPMGLADTTPEGRRGGQRSFRQAMENIRPRIHLCGHLHRLQRRDLPDGRAVLNAGHGALGQGWLIRWERRRWDATPLASLQQQGGGERGGPVVV